MALSYYEQLQHPHWIKKKQELLERDGWCCTICGSDLRKLEIHHLCYLPDLLAWEYDDELMVTVCCKCHTELTYELSKASGLIAFNALNGNIDLTDLNKTLIRLKSIRNGDR